MTPKQEAFIHEYLIDLNGAQAAIRAGYSENCAGEKAHELMKLPEISAAIERGKADRLARTKFEADRVLYEKSMLAFSRIDHYLVDDNGNVVLAEGAPVGAMAAVQSVKRRRHSRIDKDGTVHVTYEVEIKLWDKVTPLKLLGRHVGLFPDKVEHSGPGGAPIELVTRIERVIIDDTPRQLAAPQVKQLTE